MQSYRPNVSTSSTSSSKRKSYADIAAKKGRELVDTFSVLMTPDEVNGWFSKQLGRYPKAADVYAVAKEFFTLTAYRKASLALEMYLTMPGAQIAGEHLLGYAYYKCGRLDQAIDMFRLAVEHGFDADWQLLVEIQCELEAERRALGLIDDQYGAAGAAAGAGGAGGPAPGDDEEEVDEAEAYVRRVLKGEEGEIVVESFTERGFNRKPRPKEKGLTAEERDRLFAEAAAAGGALLRPLLVEEHLEKNQQLNLDDPDVMKKKVPVAEYVFGRNPTGPPQAMLDHGIAEPLPASGAGAAAAEADDDDDPTADLKAID